MNDKETVSAETHTTVNSDRIDSGKVSLWSRICRTRCYRYVGASHIVRDVCTVLKWPMLLGALYFDVCCVIFPLFCAMMVYGVYALIALILSQMPVWYLLIKEIRREDRRMPLSEHWETDEKRWNKALEEYTQQAIS